MSRAHTPEIDPAAVNLFAPEIARCPQAAYAELRETCPVSRAAVSNTAIVSRYEDVIWALRHPEIFSSAMEVQMGLGTARPMIPQQLDPPQQTRYRRLLDPHFSRRKMEALVPSVRQQANALIDGLIADGHCEFNQAFAIPLPCTAFLNLLGLPSEDLAVFLAYKDNIIRPEKGRADKTPEELHAVRVSTGGEIYGYFSRALDEREASPRDDMLTSLLVSELDGERLSREEILDISFLLLLAGLDTVTATLGCNMAYLAANPEQRRQISGRPELIPGAVEELLRWETPVTVLPRLVKQQVELSGVTLMPGEMVSLLIGSANTDGAHFADPDQVQFDRDRNVHVAFGAGPHRCLGSHLARMELRVAMEEWHRRIPEYRIPEGEVPRYSPGIREVNYLPLDWRA